MTLSAAASTFSKPDRILSPRELADRVGLSLATLWRLRRRGDLPEPMRLSPGRVGWPESEIDTWLASRSRSERLTARSN
jgi:prophage regulatory protein